MTEEERDYQSAFNQISDLAKRGLLKDYVEYTQSDGAMVRQFADEVPEFIDFGNGWVSRGTAESMGMIRKWRCTSTGWVLE